MLAVSMRAEECHTDMGSVLSADAKRVSKAGALVLGNNVREDWEEALCVSPPGTKVMFESSRLVRQRTEDPVLGLRGAKYVEILEK